MNAKIFNIFSIIAALTISANATLILDAPSTNVVQIDQPITINNNTISSTSGASTVAFETQVNNTNLIQFLGEFTQNVTEQYITQTDGVNVFTPFVESTNVSGEWTIALTTNNPVKAYIQTGNITSVVFSVDSTNDVALGEVLFAATTNSLTWPTNGLTWAAGDAPTLTTGQWSIILFHAWRDDVHGVYVGDSP